MGFLVLRENKTVTEPTAVEEIVYIGHRINYSHEYLGSENGGFPPVKTRSDADPFNQPSATRNLQLSSKNFNACWKNTDSKILCIVMGLMSVVNQLFVCKTSRKDCG